MLIDASNHPNFDAHEEVHAFHDKDSGLTALLAIHRTGPLGIAGGGCRMWPHESEEAALADALRLSQAMTYKLALAGLGAGGGKCVVIGEPRRDKTPDLLEELGHCINSLHGRFVVGGDVGIGAEDLKLIARPTPYVELGSYGRDTVSEATAGGVFWAIVTALRYLQPTLPLAGARVAIQGTGKVGARLAELLAAEGAKLFVSDIDEPRAKALAEKLSVDFVPSEEIAFSEVDVYAPCALGDVLSESSVPQLRCRCVVGSANNQLKTLNVANTLQERGILYVPDFIANMGGSLAAAKPHQCHDEDALHLLTRKVGEITALVIDDANRKGVSPQLAAVDLAEERITQLRNKNAVVGSLFQWMWRSRTFARVAMRARTVVEELRGRWA